MMASKLWRTLVRVVACDGDGVDVCVPGWNPDMTVRVPSSGLPPHVLAIVRSGKRLHAMANIGANRAEDLVFQDWETE